MVNQLNLQKAWNMEQVTTTQDWEDWMRRFSVSLLRESPGAALRACSTLAQVTLGCSSEVSVFSYGTYSIEDCLPGWFPLPIGRIYTTSPRNSLFGLEELVLAFTFELD